MSSPNHKRSTPSLIATVLVMLLAALASVLFFTERWAIGTWANLKFDEILYHLNTTLEGTNPEMVRDYIVNYASLALIAILVVGIVLFLARKQKQSRTLSLVLVALLSLGTLGWTLYDFDKQTGAGAYARSALGLEKDSTFIEDAYVDPASIKLTFPEKKRNLIYIYLESMETTFTDPAHGGAFEQSVIPGLTDIALENECFAGNSGMINGGYAFPGCTWTMGAIFAHSSGLPLKVPVGRQMMSTQEQFFPGITSIGDVLLDEGYNQAFLCGSDITFAGRDLFFRKHGNYTLYDWVYAQEAGYIPQGYEVFWGYEDEKLFEIAKKELTKMAKEDKPFNFTMLTVDTHFEDGYVCDLCGDEFGNNQYANVFACSDRQTLAFLDWLSQQDFYEDTTIVLVGDHCTMDNDFCENIPEDYQRRAYTAIINGAAEVEDPTWTREYSTFDLYPTTLAAMGVDIEGNRLGIGTNLYSSKKTLVEEFGAETCEYELDKPSAFLDEASGVSFEDIDWDQFLEQIKLVLALEEGHVGYRVWGLYNAADGSHIKHVRVHVTDTRTGDENDIFLDTFENPDNPFLSYHLGFTDYPESDYAYLDAEGYVELIDGREVPIGSIKGSEIVL